MKIERNEEEVWSFNRSTHFDCRGKLIANPKMIWGHPDICPKFPLIQEVRLGTQACSSHCKLDFVNRGMAILSKVGLIVKK